MCAVACAKGDVVRRVAQYSIHSLAKWEPSAQEWVSAFDGTANDGKTKIRAMILGGRVSCICEIIGAFCCGACRRMGCGQGGSGHAIGWVCRDPGSGWKDPENRK